MQLIWNSSLDASCSTGPFKFNDHLQFALWNSQLQFMALCFSFLGHTLVIWQMCCGTAHNISYEMINGVKSFVPCLLDSSIFRLDATWVGILKLIEENFNGRSQSGKVLFSTLMDSLISIPRVVSSTEFAINFSPGYHHSFACFPEAMGEGEQDQSPFSAEPTSCRDIWPENRFANHQLQKTLMFGSWQSTRLQSVLHLCPSLLNITFPLA